MVSVTNDAEGTIIERIRKILNKQESLREIGTPSALNEAEVCATLVQRLLTQHKLDLTKVVNAQVRDEDPIGESRFDFYGTGTPKQRKRVVWVEDLAGSVAKAYYCRILVGRNGDVWFVGKSEDRAIAATMFGILNVEVRAGLEVAWREATRRGEYMRGFISTFNNTAVARIRRRYEEMRQELERDLVGTTAMVRVVDAELADYMTKFGRGVAISNNHAYNTAGRAAGTAFGDSVSLSTNGIAGGVPAPRAIAGRG